MTTVNDLTLTEFHWSDGGNHGLGDSRRYVRIVAYQSPPGVVGWETRLRTTVTRTWVRVEVWEPPIGWIEVIASDTGWEDAEAVEVMADYEYRALRILGDVDL